VFLDYEYADEPYTLLHEIGHALGFKHPFEGDPTLGSKLDNTSNTVMSYTGTRVDNLSPFDIDAVRAVYGNAASDAAGLASWNFNANSVTLNRTGLDTGNDIFGVGIRDVIDGAGGGDLICGFEGDDTLKGGSGRDTIYGGIGNDTIRGDKGADILLGEEGDDRFEFTNVNTGGDTVKWFSQDAGDDDTLAFSEKAFGSLGRDDDGTGTLESAAFQAGFGHVASSAGTRFMYDWSNGQLWYDADGTGSSAAKLLLTLNNFADLVAADIVIF
jgi:Ca2+-binding RTX toxin-like protein